MKPALAKHLIIREKAEEESELCKALQRYPFTTLGSDPKAEAFS
jgi:hypothetical protein